MSNPILIIEDNEQNMYLMRFLLENDGLVIIGAEDGIKGVEMAISCRPSVILLDIQLPEMDGYAVAEELKKYEKLKHVPIVAVTSYAMLGDKERILGAGATGYIEKPINPDTFVSEIKQYIPKNLKGHDKEDEDTQCG